MRSNGWGPVWRALARAPVRLYRAELGFLFGHRLLLLEHTGRRTGLPRYVVLEVVDRPAPGCYVVPAGFGERSQWLRNVRACPRVRVSVARRTLVEARARELPVPEAAELLRGYARRHRLSWLLLRPVLRGLVPGLAGRPDELATRVPLVELTLSS